MSSHSDFDTLIAAMHPHVVMSVFNFKLCPPPSLYPGDSKDTEESRKLAQALASLFGFYPGCTAAAVAVRAFEPFIICPSPSIPSGFKNSLEKWSAQIAALLKEDESKGNRPREDSFSSAEKHFILHTYKTCYPAMHQLISDRGFGDWNSIVTPREHLPGSKPTDEEAELTQKYANEIRAFSGLVRNFAERVSHESLGEDEDILQFHRLCVEIQEMRSNDGFMHYLNTFVHYGIVQPRLAYFNVPLAISTIITLSRERKISLDNLEGWDPLDPSEGARPFSAVIEETFLEEHFGEAHDIQWKAVVEAFNRRWVPIKDRSDPNVGKNTLSTAEPINLHPEITLIQHLLHAKGGRNLKGAKVHIACSRTPCYATGAYAVAMNETFRSRFTMDVNDPEWSRLSQVELWILPTDAPEGVVAKMKESLLEDLDRLTNHWMRRTGFSVPLSGDFSMWE